MIKLLPLYLMVVFLIPQDTFNDVLKASVKSQRKTLLVFSGSDWCRGCITFKTNVLDTEAFSAYSASKLGYFVADFPRDKALITAAQLEENQSLADQFNKKGLFPYLVLFDEKGKAIRRKAGGFSTLDDLMKWVEL